MDIFTVLVERNIKKLCQDDVLDVMKPLFIFKAFSMHFSCLSRRIQFSIMNKVSHDIMQQCSYKIIMFKSTTEWPFLPHCYVLHMPTYHSQIRPLQYSISKQSQTFRHNMPQQTSACPRRTEHLNLLRSLTSSV